MGAALLGTLVLASIPGLPGLPEAIQAGNVDTVRRLLAEGADLGRRDHRGYTALMLAIERRNCELAEDLLEAGVDLQAQAHTPAFSALRLALMYLDPRLVRRLLAAGADPNERSLGGQTPLFFVGPSTENLELLLAAGANLNVQDDQGDTVLMRVSAEGSHVVARALLAHGARTDLYNADGQAAMSIARMYGNAKVRDLLCEAGVADVDGLPPSLADPALDFAARALARGEFQLVMGLAEAEVNLQRQVAPGLTLLHYAARWGAPDAVPTLLEALPSMRIDTPSGSGHTPLWFAVLAGRPDVVRLLARQGASLEGRDTRRRMPLDAAILNDDLGMVRTLLELEAPVGELQLRYAIDNDRLEALVALFPRAKPEDRAKFTAGGAAMVGAKRCVLFLFRAQPHERDLAAAAQYGDDALVEELVRLGASVHPPPNVGSPLSTAAFRGLACSVRAMLDAGADPNAIPESGGRSALSAAATAGHADVIRMLCDAGADTEFKDYRGYTTLTAAAASGHLEAVRALLDGGADVDRRDTHYRSAWQHAARGGHERVARALVEAGASTLSFEDLVLRQIARDGLLTIACWVGLAMALGSAILRPAALGFAMGAAAALFTPSIVGILVPGAYVDLAEALDPPYFRLLFPEMAIVLVIALALHGAALVVVGKLCRSRILAATLVLGLSLGVGAMAWRAWFPDHPVDDLLKMTGLPLLVLAALIETRHRDPRLAAATSAGVVALAVIAAVVSLLRGLALIRAPLF